MTESKFRINLNCYWVRPNLDTFVGTEICMSHVFSAGLSFCKHALESLLSLAFLQGTLGQERNLCPTNLPLLCTTT